jgi:hypothetical protein
VASVLRLLREHPRHFRDKLECEEVGAKFIFERPMNPGTSKEVLKTRNDIRQPFAGFDEFSSKIKPTTTLSQRSLTAPFVRIRLFLMIDPKFVEESLKLFGGTPFPAGRQSSCK